MERPWAHLLTPERKEYLLALVLQIQRGRRRHVWHPEAEDVVYIGSAHARAVLGFHSREILRTFFEVVSEDYSARAGVAKAYRLRPERRAEILSWMNGLQKSRPRAKGERDVHAVVVNLERLRELAETDLQCAALLSKTHDTGRGRGVVYERYRRTREAGRRFVVGLGVQQLPKATRREILSGLNLVEVDAVNCLPTLMDQLAGGRLATLHRYATDREGVLREIASHCGRSRAWAKALLLMVTGGASLSGRSLRAHAAGGGAPLSGMKGEEAEQSGAEEGQERGEVELPQVVQDYAEDLNELSRWLARRLGMDPEDRRRWSTLAKVAQMMEDEVLQACERYHRRRGEEVSVLIFDGYLVRGLEWVDAVDVEDLSSYVKRATGWSMRFRCEALDGVLG